MGRKIRWVMMALLLVVFCTAGSMLFSIHRDYEKEDNVYKEAAAEFTHRVEPEKPGEKQASGEALGDGPEEAEGGIPLEVDFDELLKINDEIIGWLYCEDTRIDYPVLQGDDNDFYLSHNFKKERQNAGSVFVEALNNPGLADSNTIIYAHQMNDGSMFDCLRDWEEQEFYESHREMWLLTPEVNYKVVLFSGYITSAYSDTYTIFTGPCTELEEYLRRCVENSDFQAEVELGRNEKYVTLSTCAYDFEDARYVLHGKLVPMGK